MSKKRKGCKPGQAKQNGKCVDIMTPPGGKLRVPPRDKKIVVEFVPAMNNELEVLSILQHFVDKEINNGSITHALYSFKKLSDLDEKIMQENLNDETMKELTGITDEEYNQAIEQGLKK